MEMITTAQRDCHAADAGVIVVQRAQGGPDELYEMGMVWEEGVLPERSERFSARANMCCSAYNVTYIFMLRRTCKKLILLHFFST
jgi:hypothetical protein